MSSLKGFFHVIQYLMGNSVSTQKKTGSSKASGKTNTKNAKNKGGNNSGSNNVKNNRNNINRNNINRNNINRNNINRNNNNRNNNNRNNNNRNNRKIHTIETRCIFQDGTKECITMTRRGGKNTGGYPTNNFNMDGQLFDVFINNSNRRKRLF